MLGVFISSARLVVMSLQNTQDHTLLVEKFATLRIRVRLVRYDHPRR